MGADVETTKQMLKDWFDGFFGRLLGCLLIWVFSWWLAGGCHEPA